MIAHRAGRARRSGLVHLPAATHASASPSGRRPFARIDGTGLGRAATCWLLDVAQPMPPVFLHAARWGDADYARWPKGLKRARAQGSNHVLGLPQTQTQHHARLLASSAAAHSGHVGKGGFEAHAPCFDPRHASTGYTQIQLPARMAECSTRVQEIPRRRDNARTAGAAVCKMRDVTYIPHLQGASPARGKPSP